MVTNHHRWQNIFIPLTRSCSHRLLFGSSFSSEWGKDALNSTEMRTSLFSGCRFQRGGASVTRASGSTDGMNVVWKILQIYVFSATSHHFVLLIIMWWNRNCIQRNIYFKFEPFKHKFPALTAGQGPLNKALMPEHISLPHTNICKSKWNWNSKWRQRSFPGPQIFSYRAQILVVVLHPLFSPLGDLLQVSLQVLRSVAR